MRYSLTPLLAAFLFAIQSTAEEIELPYAKRPPLMQVVPEPYDQLSFQRNSREITRYHYGENLRRPFLYPVIGHRGLSLTRMGHPHDPVGHSHHNSVWVSHQNVGGVDFWSDRGENVGKIVHQQLVRDSFVDSDQAAAMQAINHWVGPEGKRIMKERRRVELRPAGNGESLIVIDLQFEPPGEKETVTIGQTAFGMIGVRMAKSIGVRDGGGLIRNSEGNVNEQGENGCFRKPARWVDYSGPIDRAADGVDSDGITLLDHPANPGHPSPFHVRGDGWMGACLTLKGPHTIQEGETLRLRYGLWVHNGAPAAKAINDVWESFAQEKPAILSDSAK